MAERANPGPAVKTTPEKARELFERFWDQWPLVPIVYLAGIGLAELLTAAANPRLGMLLHVFLLLVLLPHGALLQDKSQQKLLWCLTLAPLIRILSLSLPLTPFPILYWYAITAFPFLAATFTLARTVGYKPEQIGLRLSLRDPHYDLLIALLGLPLGAVEYWILAPRPLAAELSWSATWLPALILMVSTGFTEEVTFRGVLQRAGQEALGQWGPFYVSLLFAVLHIGYLSVADVVFVMLVALLFARVVQATGSIWGVALCHGLVNISLFLIMPFLIS